MKNVFLSTTREVKNCWLSRYQDKPIVLKVYGCIGLRSSNKFANFFRSLLHLSPKVVYEYAVTSDLDKMDVRSLDQNNDKVAETILRFQEAERQMEIELSRRVEEFTKRDRK